MNARPARVSPWLPFALTLALLVTTVALAVTSFTSDTCPGAGCAWWWLLVTSFLATVVATVIVFRALVVAQTRSAPARPSGGLSTTQAELTSMIAHELKNPIMSIKGLAATGSRLYDSMSDEERKEFFRLIDEESTRLKLIADETSAALKIDAGQLHYDIRPDSLTSLVEESTWRTRHGEHPVLVETEQDLMLPIDRLRIQEVLANLLDNAAKFSPPAEPIEVRAYLYDDDAVIEVTDRGPGIPPTHHELVFQKFCRYRPTGYEEVPGAGLGLFISRAHVEAHGGSITIQPGRETGTMLRVTLPKGS